MCQGVSGCVGPRVSVRSRCERVRGCEGGCQRGCQQGARVSAAGRQQGARVSAGGARVAHWPAHGLPGALAHDLLRLACPPGFWGK